MKIYQKSLMAMGILCALPTIASAADSGRTVAIEEVVVTAQKREESLQDAPIAISAFSAEDIENKGVAELADLGRLAPNVVINKTPASNATVAMSIRGISSAEPSLSVDPSVAVYINGIYQARTNAASTEVVDLERVEILRGPQGTLYGRNTTGGAINMITSKPTGEFGVTQKLTTGNYGRFKSHTKVELPQMGALTGKVSYLNSSYDGHVDNTTTRFMQGPADDFGASDVDAVNVAFNFSPSDDLSIDLTATQTNQVGTPSHFQITNADPVPPSVFGSSPDFTLAFGPGQNDGAYADLILLGTYAAFGNQPMAGLCSMDSACTTWANASNPVFGGASPAQAQLGMMLGVMGNAAAVADNSGRVDAAESPYHGREDVDTKSHSLAVSYDINDSLQLKYLYGYSELDMVHRTGMDGGGNLDIGSTVITMFAAGNPNTKSQEQTSHELQFIGSIGERIEYVGGLYSFEEEGTETTREQTMFNFGGWGAARSYDVENKAQAAFLQTTISATDQLDITAGIRYTEDDREVIIYEGDTTAVFSEEFDNTSGSLTFNYAWTDDLSTYFRASTGYKAGGFLSRTPISAQQPFDEETLTSFELGLKSTWMDNRIRLNAAIYSSEYDDKQVAVFVPTTSGAVAVTQNAAQSTYEGIEIELTAVLAEGLIANINYGHIDAEYEEYNYFDSTGTTCGTAWTSCDVSAGASFGSTPDDTLSGGISYEFAPMAIGNLAARVDFAYNSGYTFGASITPVAQNANQYTEAESHTLVGARITLSEIPMFDDIDLKVSLWGKNLTDEEYRVYGIGEFAALGFAGATYNDPRSYGVDVTFNF